MVHEHQNPTGGIQWDEQAVLRYFSGAPNFWDEEQIRFNVMDKYDSNLLNASKYDPKSIMLYAFPASLTLNGVATQANAVMSPVDIEWMSKVYGKPKKNEKKGKKKKDKKRKRGRKIKTSESVLSSGKTIKLSSDGKVLIEGKVSVPDDMGNYKDEDGNIVAVTNEQGDIVVVIEEKDADEEDVVLKIEDNGTVVIEDKVEKTDENGMPVKPKKKTALIVGIISIIVIASILGIVFGVIIPRKRRRV
jgi:hypothetical protein